MIKQFASADLTIRQLNAIVRKLGGPDRALQFLRDELTVSGPYRSWKEKENIITFSVTSDGTNGKDWIKRLERNDFRVSDYAKKVLNSSYFKPTDAVISRAVIIKHPLYQVMNKIRAKANECGLSESNLETACLIREKFSDAEIKAMGLWDIVVMHKPLTDPSVYPGVCDDVMVVSRGFGGR